jgi:iron-sulfur cluster insertion protein
MVVQWAVLPKRAPAPSNRCLQGRVRHPISHCMTVSLTQSAASRVAAIATKLGKPAILRLSVDGGGCSGFQYRFGLADLIESDDVITSLGDVRLVVDPVSLDLVNGSAVDFVESLGGAAFRVTNPNAASGCGCGASFSV